MFDVYRWSMGESSHSPALPLNSAEHFIFSRVICLLFIKLVLKVSVHSGSPLPHFCKYFPVQCILHWSRSVFFYFSPCVTINCYCCQMFLLCAYTCCSYRSIVYFQCISVAEISGGGGWSWSVSYIVMWTEEYCAADGEVSVKFVNIESFFFLRELLNNWRGSFSCWCNVALNGRGFHNNACRGLWQFSHQEGEMKHARKQLLLTAPNKKLMSFCCIRKHVKWCSSNFTVKHFIKQAAPQVTKQRAVKSK